MAPYRAVAEPAAWKPHHLNMSPTTKRSKRKWEWVAVRFTICGIPTPSPLNFEDEISATCGARKPTWKDYGIMQFTMSRSDLTLHVHTHEMDLRTRYYWWAWCMLRYWLPRKSTLFASRNSFVSACGVVSVLLHWDCIVACCKHKVLAEIHICQFCA
jgi:hypothetical protein